MKERHYMAFGYVGGDTVEWEFTSRHRAGSAANRDDAMHKAWHKYENRIARNIELKFTYLIKEG